MRRWQSEEKRKKCGPGRLVSVAGGQTGVPEVCPRAQSPELGCGRQRNPAARRKLGLACRRRTAVTDPLCRGPWAEKRPKHGRARGPRPDTTYLCPANMPCTLQRLAPSRTHLMRIRQKQPKAEPLGTSLAYEIVILAGRRGRLPGTSLYGGGWRGSRSVTSSAAAAAAHASGHQLPD